MWYWTWTSEFFMHTCFSFEMFSNNNKKNMLHTWISLSGKIKPYQWLFYWSMHFLICLLWQYCGKHHQSEELGYKNMILEWHFAKGGPDTLKKNYYAEVEIFMVTAAFPPCFHFSSLAFFYMHSVSQPLKWKPMQNFSERAVRMHEISLSSAS